MTSATTTPVAAYLELPLAQLFDSALNPRRRFHQTKVDEIAASIRTHGIIEPLVVRPRVSGGFEVVAGHYRLRAAMAAPLDVVPCVQRQLTDLEALEVMLIENKQREDVHPLDEADGYARLHELDGAYSPEAIAAKVGVSTSYVYRRLKLREMIPEAREVFEADEITAAHAERLARLTPKQQQDALPECFYPIFRGSADPDAKRRDIAPVAKLDAWIESHTRLQPAAPEVQHYFPAVAAAVDAVDDATGDEPPASLIELSESHMPGPLLGKKHGALARGSWTPILTKKDRCAHVQRGVIVHGGRPRVLDVCATKGCPKHRPVAKKAKTAEAVRAKYQQQLARQDAERKRQEIERKAWDEMKPKAYQAFAEFVKGQQMTGELLREVLNDHDMRQIESAIGGRITDKNMGQAAAISCLRLWSRQEFLKSAKPFGFNLGSVEQQHKAATAKTTPAKAGAKKPTTRARKAT